VKYLFLALGLAAGLVAAHLTGVTAADPTPAADPPDREAKVANPSIDMPGFLTVAQQAEAHRRTRRVTEDEFLTMSREKGTVVLDARSRPMYDLLHVEGAVNLSFPDIDVESLPKLIPDKNTRILIYCNNNFTPAPGTAQAAQAAVQQAQGQGPQPGSKADVARQAFRGKGAVVSLNVSTYTTLYAYGYRNVYELGPLVDPAKTKLPLVATK